MQSYRKLCSPSYLAALRRFTSESQCINKGIGLTWSTLSFLIGTEERTLPCCRKQKQSPA